MLRFYYKYIIILSFLLFSDCMSQFADGVFEGKSIGRKDRHYNGEIEVRVTISNSRIKSVDVITFNQSVDHKKYGRYVAQVTDTIPGAIVKNQSLNVDAISSATISSNALLAAVAAALEKSYNGVLKDGIYSGTAIGKRDKPGGGSIDVRIKISASKIDSIFIDLYEQKIDHKKYGKNILAAKKQVPNNVIQMQSISVDGVSGATISSNALKLAVARALEKAQK